MIRAKKKKTVEREGGRNPPPPPLRVFFLPEFSSSSLTPTTLYACYAESRTRVRCHQACCLSVSPRVAESILWGTITSSFFASFTMLKKDQNN